MGQASPSELCAPIPSTVGYARVCALSTRTSSPQQPSTQSQPGSRSASGWASPPCGDSLLPGAASRWAARHVPSLGNRAQGPITHSLHGWELRFSLGSSQPGPPGAGLCPPPAAPLPPMLPGQVGANQCAKCSCLEMADEVCVASETCFLTARK